MYNIMYGFLSHNEMGEDLEISEKLLKWSP